MRLLLKKYYSSACAYYLLSDLVTHIIYPLGLINTNSGTAHAGLSLSKSVNYINEVFMDYKHYAGVGQFYGRVAEIGPGDNCGVALMFLADGCDFVDLADRFYSKRNKCVQANIYSSLLANSKLFEHIGNANLEDEDTFSGIKRWYGEEAAAEKFFNLHKRYDFIVSRAVLEHLYDPLLCLKKMTEALNPGGMLLHKVDLSDHGMFSSNFHELKFLEVPDMLYRRMTISSGRPNRILLHQYRSCLEELGIEYTLLVTRLAGIGEIKPHIPYHEIPLNIRKESLKYVHAVRHKFSYSFRNVSDEDLSVRGFFLVGKKSE